MTAWRSLQYVMVLSAVLTSGATSSAVGEPEPPAEHELLTVREADVVLRVGTTGTIRPKNRIVVPAPISGKVAWVIDEGTRVKAGTEVARVDCTDHLESLAQHKLERSVVQAELRRAQLEARLVRETLASEVTKAELALKRARLKLSTLGPPTDTDRELSQLTVDQTKFAMNAAEKEWQRVKKLGESGIESDRTIAVARLKFERARADHLKAAADHRLLLKGDPQEDIDVAFQEVKRAETVLDLARKRLTGQVAYQATQVEVAQLAVDRVQAFIDLQQGRIDRSRVVAPTDGVVCYPRYWGMPIREGDPVWRSNRFMDIADLSTMTIEAVVNQIDWPRLKAGQEADVRLVAYPKLRFHGVVRKVGVLARDRSLILREKPANVMSFHVLIDVVEEAPELRPSYTAKVSIVTDRFANVIAVPRAAVFRRGGGYVVWVKTGDVTAMREVTLGPSDVENAVITDGLGLGDVVLVPRTNPGETP